MISPGVYGYFPLAVISSNFYTRTYVALVKPLARGLLFNGFLVLVISVVFITDNVHVLIVTTLSTA